jgi:hypothetical protein
LGGRHWRNDDRTSVRAAPALDIVLQGHGTWTAQDQRLRSRLRRLWLWTALTWPYALRAAFWGAYGARNTALERDKSADERFPDPHWSSAVSTLATPPAVRELRRPGRRRGEASTGMALSDIDWAVVTQRSGLP